MSGQRAIWQLAQAMDNDDPFATALYSSGIELDLTASEQELAGAFTQLLWQEGTLLAEGVTCELKDDGQDCLHCAVATLDNEHPRSRLCRLGKDQSTIEKRFLVRQAERLAPISDLIALADQASEIGALPDQLAELVTEVGL